MQGFSPKDSYIASTMRLKLIVLFNYDYDIGVPCTKVHPLFFVCPKFQKNAFACSSGVFFPSILPT